jgi:nesprin-1
MCYFLQLRHWLWLLDSGLPGDLGQVGEWLGRAEALIASDDIPTIMNEETASIISRKLEEHKVKPTLTMEIKR